MQIQNTHEIWVFWDHKTGRSQGYFPPPPKPREMPWERSGLRRRQIMLQRRVVESQRCSSSLQPNHYGPRRKRARRQILTSLS